MYCESFYSERDFKALIANHLIQNRTSKHYRESFDSEQDFKARMANNFIQNRKSKHVS